jgi:predicted enzyme related to lactoylglutathione lyase
MVSREAPSAAAPPRPGDVVYASLWSADVERAERFYGAVLGWVTARGYGPQERQVTNAGTRLGLSGGHARPTAMLCYAVPDLDAAVAVVRAAGGTAGDPTGEPYVRTAGGEARPRTSIWGGHSEDAAVVPTFAVPDLAAAVRAVRAAGGTSTEPEQRRFGTVAECRDDQDGRFQLVER